MCPDTPWQRKLGAFANPLPVEVRTAAKALADKIGNTPGEFQESEELQAALNREFRALCVKREAGQPLDKKTRDLLDTFFSDDEHASAQAYAKLISLLRPEVSRTQEEEMMTVNRSAAVTLYIIARPEFEAPQDLHTHLTILRQSSLPELDTFKQEHAAALNEAERLSAYALLQDEVGRPVTR